MRCSAFSLALAAVALSFVAAPDARAQYVSVYYDSGYSLYYAPTYYPPAYYYSPGVYAYGAYAPSPYWYGSYYYGPGYRGWYYGSYSPYTNQYYWVNGQQNGCKTGFAGTSPLRSYYFYGPGQLSNPCDQFHWWSFHAGGCNFLMSDGSVHFLTYSLGPLVLDGLVTRNGGEVIPSY